MQEANWRSKDGGTSLTYSVVHSSYLGKRLGAAPCLTPAIVKNNVSHQCSVQLWDWDSFVFHVKWSWLFPGTWLTKMWYLFATLTTFKKQRDLQEILGGKAKVQEFPSAWHWESESHTDQKGKKKLPSKPSWHGLTLFFLKSKCHGSSKEGGV